MTSLQPQKGHLLVAKPSIIGDVSFNRSIVLLTEHTSKGFVGFIINKPLTYTLQDLIPDINSTLQVYNGGPVEQDNLYFIHQAPQLIPSSIEISNGIYWGGNFDVIKQLLSENRLSPTDIRFFLGYSGWDVDQLEQELETNSWIVSENHYKKSLSLIAKSPDSFWREKMMELGGDYVLWSNAPENPTFN